MQASFKTPKGHPKDYFVPNFGVDKDVLTTQKHISEAEKERGVKFNASFKTPKGHPKDYYVPNFGQDKDIKDTITHTQAAEKRFKHVFSASFKTPKGHPKDYFVPNFGQDQDVKDTLKHASAAETRLKHKWAPELVQAEEEINIDSDPICSSAGCDQYKHPHPKLSYELNYPVPNLGKDHEINENFHSLDIAENMLNHKFNFGTKETKEKYKNPAKDVDYNFAPKLDEDVISTQKSLSKTESNMGQTYHLF